MKKLSHLLLIILIGLLSLSAARYHSVVSVKRDGSYLYEGFICWHKKVIDGSDSLITYNTTSATVYGASDTLYSDCYFNKGALTISPIITGDTTMSAQVIVQTALLVPNTTTNLPDTLFRNYYWCKFGNSADSSYVTGECDSVVVAKSYSQLPIPLYAASMFRFLVITSAVNAGAQTFSLPAILKEL